MRKTHIAFWVEPAYGHIIPTLGIASELLKRGHIVSYAIPESFAPIVRKVHAELRIVRPLDNRSKILAAFHTGNDYLSSKVDTTAHTEVERLYEEITNERTIDLLGQLEQLYRDDRPDVIIHNTSQDRAGRDLAKKWGIATIRHQTQFIETRSPDYQEDYAYDALVLIAVPGFFQRDLANLDRRFHIVGFSPGGRMDAFDHWEHAPGANRPILISATTGMLPQVDFYRTMIETFRDKSWEVVLSIAGVHDVVSAIDTAQFPDIPPTIRLNRTCGNFSILPSSCLYIGQGGQGSTLEAIYHGIPQIVIPPTQYHFQVGHRVSELGLGLCLPMNELSTASLAAAVGQALRDEEMSARVKEAAISMRRDRGEEFAADLIEQLLSGRA